MWKPAPNQEALNPIIYLKMNDPTQPGKNLGTGGDFNLTGVVARSGRGPNQYNAPYSDLDGTADYLSRTTAPTGIADGKAFTLHFAINRDTLSTVGQVVVFSSGLNVRFAVGITAGGNLNIQARNAAGTIIFAVSTVGVTAVGRNYVIDVSVDLASTSTRHFLINGAAPSSLSWDTYTNDTIDFAIATTPQYRIGANEDASPALWYNGRLGNVFFDTRYIDLSVPANLAKFVTGTGIDAKPADIGANGELPFGTPPLIYLPMYGNNPGKNYGTGGDFTVFT